MSESLQSILESTNILPGIYSDHSIVQLVIKSEEFTRGTGFWRLNTNLLSNLEYVNVIKKVLIENNKDVYTDKRAKFDFLKFKVKEASIKISKEIARKNREEIKKAEVSLEQAEKALLDCPDSRILKDQIHDAQSILERHYQRINEGLIIQSRVQYYEEGEKGSQFFLNIMKQNANKSTIRQLKINENAPLITDQKAIMSEIESFYKNLYTSRRSNDEASTKDVKEWIIALKNAGHIPQLDDDDKQLLEQDIDLLDLKLALKDCGKNKSPGNDGLPYEFYSKFWDDIKSPLYKSITESIEKGEMSTSQKQSFI